MFSVNNLYDYLTHTYTYNQKNFNGFFFKFKEDGGRDLNSLLAIYDKEFYYQKTQNLNIIRFYTKYFLFDQEPFNFDQYYFDADSKYKSTNLEFYTQNLSKIDAIQLHLATVQTPIICHSEKNSDDINLLTSRGFRDVYYWYHGLVARDWFRHWKHYTPIFDTNSKRFGTYIRDITGSRRYRLDLLNQLTKISNSVYFKIQSSLRDQLPDNIKDAWDQSTINFDGNSSAKITWDDTEKFQIQIVAETIFETPKIHLTEKILKSIAMEQPFILFAGPGSLEYLRSYGFQTFNDLWNEDYDQITSHTQRFENIIKLIKTLNELPKNKFDELMTKAKKIAEFNRSHFYSNNFENKLLQELANNFETANTLKLEDFNTCPGNTWLDIINILYQRTGSIGENNIKSLYYVINFMKEFYPIQANLIIKKYNHLF